MSRPPLLTRRGISPSSNMKPSWQFLEREPSCELDGSSRTSAADHTEIGSAENDTRKVEVGMIEQVVEFTAHVEFQTFAQSERFLQRCVGGHQRRSSQHGPR